MDDTFAIDGGKDASRWKAKRGNPSCPAKRPYYGGGRKKSLSPPRQFPTYLPMELFAKIERLAILNRHSINKQIIALCEKALAE